MQSSVTPSTLLRRSLMLAEQGRSRACGAIPCNVLAGLGVLSTLLYLARMLRTGIANFIFDDALMFVRYADHMRSGYGISWDPGGPHTYGLTSLSWLGVTWLASYTPLAPITKMVSLSCLCGMAGFVVLAGMARSSKQTRLSPVTLFPLIALPLMMHQYFAISFNSGMETMLAFLLIALYLPCVQRAFLTGKLINMLPVGLLGWMIVLTRPEAALSVFSFPLSWWLLVERRNKSRALVTLLGLLSALLVMTLVWAHVYFGTALPLPLYSKWILAPAGYRLYLNPIAYTLYFLNMAGLPCVVLICLVRRHQARLMLAFMLPLALQCASLFSVLQIMGWGGRYYVPYLPFLFVPAIQVLACDLPGTWPRFTPQRLSALVGLCLLLNLQVVKPLSELAGRIITRHHSVYREPEFRHQAQQPLPELPWWPSCQAVARIAAVLPAGALVSSSEVGLLGAMRPDLRILDSSGLNNAAIAQHGFSVQRVLAAKPDLIWLIHPDYTRDFGEMSTDPALLQEYTLFAHAFNFGIAIRREGLYRRELLAALRSEWRNAYPNFHLEEYEAQSVHWDSRPEIGSKRLLVTEP